MNEADRAQENRQSNSSGRTAMAEAASPYSTGGGGITFERKVAVQYLAHLLTGGNPPELGDGRRVLSLAFQQAPTHPTDDLVIHAGSPAQSQPSLVLAVAVRRAPRLVQSDEQTRKLFRGLVAELINTPATGPEHRLGLVVAGSQPQARQLAKLADHACRQIDAHDFFQLVRTPRKFNAGVRDRLRHVEELVKVALRDLTEGKVESALVQRRAWELLRSLTVCMPQLESPDPRDWSALTERLIPLARNADPLGALQLRDRLVTLAGEYSPLSAHLDLTLLRRDLHPLLDATVRRNETGWQLLDHLHQDALAAVRNEITSRDGSRRIRLDRRTAAAELVKRATDAGAIVVSGESGVGKSALAVLGLRAAAAADPDSMQTLCINLRHVPNLSVSFEATLGSPIPILLNELSAPNRVLVIDGADAVAEGRKDLFRHLVHSATESSVRVVAVTSIEGEQIVRDLLKDGCQGDVDVYVVAPLTDAEIATVAETFTELRRLSADPRSRALLRRLVVIDLLVRGRVSSIPLTDADAMNSVWSGLVRRQGVPPRGSPDAREMVFLGLADLELTDGPRLRTMGEMDPTALDGLRRDGLLRTSTDDPFRIGPEFAHDEVRRYAVARLLCGASIRVRRQRQSR